MKKLLVFGGTRFIGRHFLEAIKNKGYEITLFNRGRTNPDLYPDLTLIKGDRNTDDIEKVGGQDWDMVMDISGYFPLPMKRLLELLKGRVGRYVYVSTVSVYDLGHERQGYIDENFKKLEYTQAQIQTDGDAMKNYGRKKMACEDFLREQSDLDSIILRPSIVYGPHDYTDRMYYWMYRAKTQDTFMLPGGGTEMGCYTWVKDLAKVMDLALEQENHRTEYNVVTHAPVELRLVVKAMRHMLKTNPELVNVPFNVLKSAKQSSKDFPLVTNFSGFNTLEFTNEKIREDFGIHFTPFELTISEYAQFIDTARKWGEGEAGMRIADELSLIEDVLEGKVF